MRDLFRRESSARGGRRFLRRSIAVVAVVPVTLTWVTALALPAKAIGSAVGFSAAALPTWQTNGEVYALASAQVDGRKDEHEESFPNPSAAFSPLPWRERGRG